MKTKLMFALVGAAFGARAEAGLAYTTWHDWRYMSVAHSNCDANAECRYYADVAEPEHGPWLTNPTATGMTFTWTTRTVCGGAVDYREKGTETFARRWIDRQGAIDYMSKIHTLHLTGLKPGTTYEYRLVAAMMPMDYYSTEPFVSSEIHAFTTSDPAAKSCKVFVSSDVHGSLRLLLDPMIDRSHANDAELFFLLGDNVDDGAYNDAEYWMTFCYLDDCTRRFAKERPLVALRGNHDCWGRQAGRWSEFLPRPDNKAYYTVRQGPVLFVLLDCFEEYKAKGAGREFFAAYTNEMATWLASLKKTEEWKTAKYRVAMCHYGVVEGFGVTWPRAAFGDVLRDDTPEGRVHLFLCGHNHAYCRKDPGSSDFKRLRTGGKVPAPRKPRVNRKTGKPIPEPVYTNDFPFVEIELDVEEGMTLEATEERLAVRAWDWRQPVEDARVEPYDAIDIAP